MAKPWKDKVRLDGHCIIRTVGKHHYHTRLLNEREPAYRWYLDNGWWLSRFCQGGPTPPTIGNPDKDWVQLDD